VNQHEKVKLLFGRYKPPKLKRGRRAFCLYRDCAVGITGWTDARIPWPRCRALDSPGPGSSLLVDEELARAIRCESEVAVIYWWGVGTKAVWNWRRALGVTRTNNPGTRRLRDATAERVVQALRARVWSEEERERKRQISLSLNLGRYLKPGASVRVWTEEELVLLGTAPDAEVASRIGRTEAAVTTMRNRRGIPAPWAWTEEQVALVGTLPDAGVAARSAGASGPSGISATSWASPTRSTAAARSEPRQPCALALLGRTPDAHRSRTKFVRDYTRTTPVGKVAEGFVWE
jgi:hypothetical protein